MNHNIQCTCGQLRGHVLGKGVSNRVVCYCSDCQAFAKFLGRQDEVLDGHGGTEIIQVAQPRVNFTQGKANLAAMRLSEKGIVRWYASCCKTPIGNTLANPKISFIGLIHTLLDREHLDRDFGTSIAAVNVDSAMGEPKPKQKGLLGTLMRFFWMIIAMRLSGKYKKSQLFTASGELVVAPTVLTTQERRNLKASLS